MLFIIFILLLVQVQVAVTSFTYHPSATCTQPGTYRRQHLSTLHAARRRLGAMARRRAKTGSASKGFDQRIDDPTDPNKSLGDIYSLPPLYDLAFGYRSYEDEVDFLLDAHVEYAKPSSTDAPLRILELAAGPARHSLAALSRHPPSKVDSALALDRSQAMVDYGLQNANEELGMPGGRRDDFSYVRGDMRNVGDCTISPPFDTAWLLLGSMQHLLTNEDIIKSFSSLHLILKSGGTVVIELPHPRETFSMGECTRNGWTVPLAGDEDEEEKEYGELNIVWGDEDDEFDPVAQVRQFTVGMELSVTTANVMPKTKDATSLLLQMSKDGTSKLREIIPLRLFTLQEIDALARCSGFEMVARYGALAKDVSILDEDEAFRMVSILRKA